MDQRQRRALDPRTRKSFIHFRAKPGDGFVSPLKAEIPAPFATTASSARVAAEPEGQIGGDVCLVDVVSRHRRAVLVGTFGKSELRSTPCSVSRQTEGNQCVVPEGPRGLRGSALGWLP